MRRRSAIWCFLAHLRLDTPLATLQRHGECVDAAPPRSDPSRTSGGKWVSLVRATDAKALLASRQRSDIGWLVADGGDFLTFLLEYRAIVEGPGRLHDRIRAMRKLLATPQFYSIKQRLGPRAVLHWIADELMQEVGVGRLTAQRLVELDLFDADAIRDAPDEVLLSVRGIGRTKLAQLRASLGGPKNPSNGKP